MNPRSLNKTTCIAHSYILAANQREKR